MLTGWLALLSEDGWFAMLGMRGWLATMVILAAYSGYAVQVFWLCCLDMLCWLAILPCNFPMLHMICMLDTLAGNGSYAG